MGRLVMPWIYYILTFCFAIPTGFFLFSRGAIFSRASGQILQGVFSLICFSFIISAFWNYGWKIGIIEIFIIFGGANVGLSICAKKH